MQNKIFNRNSEKERRRSLRSNMPKAEVVLWAKIKNKQIRGYKFRRQYSVGFFIVDFYCPKLRLAIEIDGDSHFQEGKDRYDKRRQCYIELKRISFLRFTNNDIYQSIEGVVDVIDKRIQNIIITTPSNSPLKRGRVDDGVISPPHQGEDRRSG